MPIAATGIVETAMPTTPCSTEQSGRQGLSSAEAARRFDKAGPNRLPNKTADNPALIFLQQFNRPFSYLLLAAIMASFAFSEPLNAVYIGVVLLVTTLVATIQEYLHL